MKLSHALCLITLGTIATDSLAGNIRNTPKPDVNARLSEMGFSSTEITKMRKYEKNDTNTDSGMRNFQDTSLWQDTRGFSNSTWSLFNVMRNVLNNVGYSSKQAKTMLNACKAYARDAQHCVVFMASVGCAESGCGDIRYIGQNKNIFGMTGIGNNSNYMSEQQAILDWVKRYNNTWYTANEGSSDWYSFCRYDGRNTWLYAPGLCKVSGKLQDVGMRNFYNNIRGKYPTYEYCMSETGSEYSGQGYCPNGLTNSTVAYDNMMSNIRVGYVPKY
ncbi:hypothetical protein PCIT_a0184 [Pseudoalteromonas citrea]|uniref:Uncharacterized protein n=2 Tax=Pseudoalteromonas citrea TaxID=43655 RepID=A0AAD4AKJ6_9GAMM|nr:hypothetical protein [Pseudoalteromonas citrea]KAF7773849.1 hypothetical protein PCIT_a0184 [Pseudoalteromonas citrea]